MIKTFIACGFLLSANVFASTFPAIPFSQAAQDAPVIVRGIVGNSRFESPVTLYEFQVTENIKGPADTTSLVIRQPGGGNLRLSEAATLTPGEDVVLFLDEKNNQQSYDLHGLRMAKLTVAADGKLSGPALALDRQVLGQAARPQWTLSDLHELIQKQKDSGGGNSQTETPQNAAAPVAISPQNADPAAKTAPAVPQQMPAAASPGSNPMPRSPEAQSQMPPTNGGIPWKAFLIFALGSTIVGWFLFRRAG